jgi:ferric-dicitrate binding protein FerR (iron transport regulator)
MRSHDEETRYAELAARVLEAEEIPAGPDGFGNRAADVEAIERALRARTRRRRWPIAAGAVAAVAAVLVVIAWSRPPSDGAPRTLAVAHELARRPPALSIAMIEGAGALVGPSGDQRPVTVGDEIAIGTRLEVAPSGGVTLALATGTRLDLAGGARARVVELGPVQRFDLSGGVLAAKVAKLAADRRFIVGTPDVEVEVKGTRFEVGVGVEPACDAGVRTVVTVHEGVVVVRHAGGEVRLQAGARWPDCHPPRAAAAPVRRHAVTEVSRVPEPAAARELAHASTLAEQNDLFAAALAAGRRGEFDEAVRWLDRLIARHPTGQLTDSARAERRRFLDAAAQRTRPQ